LEEAKEGEVTPRSKMSGGKTLKLKNSEKKKNQF